MAKKLSREIELSVDAVPSSCFTTVLMEFCGGHHRYLDHPEPLTDKQWLAVLRNARENAGHFENLVMFGGPNRQIKKKYNFGQQALADFFEKKKATVVRFKSHHDWWWLVDLPAGLRRQLNTGVWEDQYEAEEENSWNF